MSRRLNDLIRQLVELEEAIEKQTSTLNKMRAKHAMLSTVDIPEAMTEIGSTQIITDDHFRCDVAYKIYGSLPSRENPDARFAAIDYLKAHDGAELIKSKVEIIFGKGDIRAANRTMRFIEKQIEKHVIKGESEPVVEVDNEVHAMSLQAWGRQRIKDNLPVDMATVGLRGQTIATVKKVTPK